MYLRRTLTRSSEEYISRSYGDRPSGDIELEQARRRQPAAAQRTNQIESNPFPQIARAFSIPTASTDKILPLDRDRLRRASIDQPMKVPTNLSSTFVPEPIVSAASPAVIEEK